MDELWQYIILDNTVKDWSIVLLVIISSIIILRFLRSLLIKKLNHFVSKTKTTIDDFIVSVVQSSVMPALYLLAIHFSIQYLSLSPWFHRLDNIAIMMVITFFLLKIVSSLTGYVFKQALLKNQENEQREKQSRGILLIVQTIIWALGILFLIDNLGYDITTIIAGLGIGGIAIALAAQTILGDLFSYLVIFFDKPFQIGDFIIIDDKMGTVEYIGIKTTRLRTLGGEQLICSNTDLTNSRVHNYKRMQERRVVFEFGVVYNTHAPKLKIIPQIVKQIIESAENTRFDRAHFKSFGDFSLNFEVVFYVLSSDYNQYMDMQQAINLELFEIFEKEKIEFAFPTQTVLLNKMGQEETQDLKNH
jgi:small-conductance mechanosensitive channel